MAAAAASLVSYCSDSDSENESESGTSPQKVDPDALAHLQPLKSGSITTIAVLNAAPEVAVKVNKKRAASSQNVRVKQTSKYCSTVAFYDVNMIFKGTIVW